MHHKTIKIVHIVEGFLGGTGTYVSTVLPQLARNGFDVTLICSLHRCYPDAPARISKLEAGGVRVHIIPMCREISLLRDVGAFARLARLLLKERPDIVHTHCSKAGALGRIAAVLTGQGATVHSPHCFAFLRSDSRSTKSLYFVLERLLGRLTTKLAAVSRSELATAVRSRIVAGHKCVQVGNGLPLRESLSETRVATKDSACKASLGLDEETKIVTTACRLVAYKGVFRFLKAARVSRAENAVFLLAGDGRLKGRVREFIYENGLGNKVRLLGHVADMEQIYSISDLVVLCSDAEAQPYLLLEAMRAKCAIVATRVAGNRELISPGKTGVLVSPRSSDIAAAVDELLANRNKRNKYAERAYYYFCTHHNLERQITALTQIYKSCLRNAQA